MQGLMLKVGVKGGRAGVRVENMRCVPPKEDGKSICYERENVRCERRIRKSTLHIRMLLFYTNSK